MSGEAGRPEAELLFCHQCENEWRRVSTELECPRCESEFVEVLENHHEPRDDQVDSDTEPHSDSLPHHPLHDIHPWAHDRPGPDQGNVEHVEWNPGPGIHFSRTSYRSSSPNGGFPGPRGNDPFAALFQNMFDAVQQPHLERAGNSRHGGPMPSLFSPAQQPPPPWQTHPSPFPDRQHSRPGYGGRNTYTSTTRVWPTTPLGGPSPTNRGNDHLQELMQALFQGVGHAPGPNDQAGGPGGFSGLHQLFASVLNPANAAHGDVVYTQEALDRVISQFMDQHNGSTAPGPASAAAISALPKKKVEKEMLGSDGKAECSVCMDNVELGDEVTVLPCQHWFHGECVGAWLKEHDTCPHCRQGIMPKETPNNAEATSPRSPGQEPRNSQPPLSPGADFGPGGFHFRYQNANGNGSGNGSGPAWAFRSQQDLPIPRPRTERRRSSTSRSSNGRNGGEGSSGGGGIGSAIGGWMRNHLGGGGDRSSGR